jgi:hypothetical protein
MIPRPVLTAWRNRAPWRDDRQVAQDLLLSLLAIRVAGHPFLGEHLVWRGGTCLHKLHLRRARRYSEDLDYLLVGEAQYSDVRTGLEEVVAGLGMNPIRAEVSPPRVNVWGEVEVPVVGASLKVKFEVNCADLSPCLAADYYLSNASVPPAVFRERLARHAEDPDFCSDLDVLTNLPYEGFDPRAASRELILWTDRYLDPLANRRRSANAVTRDQERWRKEGGWAPGKVRCPEYAMVDGNPSRCPRWYFEGADCPAHG